VFGQAWQDVFTLAYRVNQTFGTRLPDVPELMIHVAWTDANVRNELSEAQTAEAHGRLGVPQEELWRMIGYTPEQIEQFKDNQLADKRAQIAAVTAALRVDAGRNGAAQAGNGQNGQGAATNAQ
jgi:hypothetical protein